MAGNGRLDVGAVGTILCTSALLWGGLTGCEEETSTPATIPVSGPTTTSTGSSSTSTGSGGSGLTSTTSSTTSSSSTAQGGSGGSGGFGPVDSCDELSTNECFSNYDCADVSRRCDEVGNPGEDLACCVPGARGQGELGDPCDSGNDCASSLCIEVDPQWVCSDQCDGPQSCAEPLPSCLTIPVLEGYFSFCAP